MGFLKILLVVLVVYYAFVLAARWLMPWILRHLAKKMAAKMENQFGGFKANQFQGDEGKVGWDASSGKSSKKKPIVGEYIEFEEIE